MCLNLAGDLDRNVSSALSRKGITARISEQEHESDNSNLVAGDALVRADGRVISPAEILST